MGVLKTPEPKKAIFIEDFVPVVDYRDYVFSDSEFSTDVESDHDTPIVPTRIPVLSAKSKKNRKERTMMRYLRAAGQPGNDGLSVKRNMGARKRRRVENAQMVLSQADRDDICEDFSDMVPDTITAFSRLFLDNKSMETYQKLVGKTEEETNKILARLEKHGEASTAATASDEDADGFVHVLGGKAIKLPKGFHAMTKEEKRAHHPVLSARANFERLEGKHKSALTKKRGVNYNFIDELEHRLREFFTENPNGVWVDVIAGPNTRLYVHAVANFLSLTSASLPGDGSGKLVEIRNRRRVFMPPYGFIVPYLHERDGKSLCFDFDY
uniref:R3H-assoc domain-containing protein n=1 Tax=Panagrellus redivivus TaxID=6233 RepID=A0A7E4ZY77_PANRE